MLVLLLPGFTVLSAQGSYQLFNKRNHPEITWRVYETVHFRIIFSNGLEQEAKKAGSYAEQIYAVQQKNLGLSFKNKYAIFISDMDDIANGATTPYGYLFIWVNVSEYPKYFTGTDGWMQKVIAHEMVHALIFENTKGWLQFLFPQTFLFQVPPEIHEGLAQFYGGEVWGVKRGDQYLSLGIKNDQSEVTPTDIDFGPLYYAEGFSKIRWLRQSLDDQRIGNMFTKRNHLGLFSFGWAFKKCTGQTYSEFSEKWRKAMNVYYNWKEGLAEDTDKIGEKIKDIPVSWISVIKVSPDQTGYAFTGMESRRSFDQKLFYFDKKTKKTRVLARMNIKDNFSFSPRGDQIAFSRLHYGRHGSILSDIYRVDIKSGKQIQVTRNLRALEPVFIDDQQLIFIKNEGAATNFYHSDIQGKELEQLTHFRHERQFNDLSYSARYRQMIASYFDAQEKTYGIFILELPGKQTREIPFNMQCRFPQFSPENGREILFTSYSQNTPNVYRYNLDKEIQTAVSHQANVIMVTDWPSPGKALAIIQTDRKSNTPITLDPARQPEYYPGEIKAVYQNWLSAKPGQELTVQDKEVPGRFVGKYHALGDFRLLNLTPFPFLLREKLTFGLISIWADRLQKNNLAAVAAYNLDWPKKSNYYLGYLNKSTLFDIQAGFYFQDLTTFNYWPKNDVAERSHSAYLDITLPLVSEKSSSRQIINFGVRHEKSQVLNATEFFPSQNSALPAAPEPYKENQIYGEYRFLNVQPAITFPFAGYGFRVSSLISDHHWGSDHTYQQYQISAFHLSPWGDSLQLLIQGDLQMLHGRPAPQNSLGVNKYGTFNLYKFYSEQAYVRGGEQFYPGNRLFTASAELQAPFLHLFNLAGFFDYAVIWDSLNNYATHHLASGGFELQFYAGAIKTCLGIAKDLKVSSSKFKFYITIKDLLPF